MCSGSLCNDPRHEQIRHFAFFMPAPYETAHKGPWAAPEGFPCPPPLHGGSRPPYELAVVVAVLVVVVVLALEVFVEVGLEL